LWGSGRGGEWEREVEREDTSVDTYFFRSCSSLASTWTEELSVVMVEEGRRGKGREWKGRRGKGREVVQDGLPEVGRVLNKIEGAEVVEKEAFRSEADIEWDRFFKMRRRRESEASKGRGMKGEKGGEERRTNG
jgi:hypothetical protein